MNFYFFNLRPLGRFGTIRMDENRSIGGVKLKYPQENTRTWCLSTIKHTWHEMASKQERYALKVSTLGTATHSGGMISYERVPYEHEI